MKIVLTVPLEEPVPPLKYGGVELIVSHLLENLVSLGHETYLLGTGDSQTKANLIPIINTSIRQAYGPQEIDQWRDYIKFYSIAQMIHHINVLKPDIVHNHYAWRLLQFHRCIKVPMIHTIHGPLTAFNERHTYTSYPRENYVSISHNQRRALPQLNWVGTVYNGIEADTFKVGPIQGRRYFLFLGRTSPEKGLKEICSLIKKTSHRLIIAAKVDTIDQAYFNSAIKPLIDGTQIKFVGEVDHQSKAALLQKAKALLLWLNWEEPFGLVVIEAMASGTPVIVNPRGSMPELILDGQTGFLVNTLNQMQLKLDEVGRLNPQACRAHVEKHFTARKMTEGYLSLAQKIINQSHE